MSIDAAQWIATSSVDDVVVDRWPDYKVILLGADDVDVNRVTSVAAALLEQAHADARNGSDDIDAHIARWHQAYRDFGVAPRVARASVDALRRRAASERGLPSINTLVDLYNSVSIIHGVPIGGEDLARYDGPARLVMATGDETFHTTADGAPVIEHPAPGEPVWTDHTDVTCRRWNWRQTTRTAIHDDTRRVAFVIDSLAAPNHDGAHRAAEQLADLIPGLQRRDIG